jgi:phosphatidylserine/phosphatidylglycerophosphate/cardiolipin synthase-like enzyme
MRTFISILCLLVFYCGTCFASPELIIEPNRGRAPLLNAITHANSSVNVAMYGITDESFINAFIQAKNQHKQVRILLQKQPYKTQDENKFAITKLMAANIPLQWPSEQFQLIHQKTFLLDQREAIVMTLNLTHSSFKNERNFALIITDPALVTEIQQVFNADWQHQSITVHQADLIWSPDNSRAKLLHLIHQAQSDIQIYAEEVRDYEIVGALAQAARAGVHVKILTSMQPDSRSKKLAYLTRAGVEIHFSQTYLIHAKTMSIDHATAVIGSINLTQSSLDNNRELAVITHDHDVIRLLDKTFDGDWSG